MSTMSIKSTFHSLVLLSKSIICQLYFKFKLGFVNYVNYVYYVKFPYTCMLLKSTTECRHIAEVRCYELKLTLIDVIISQRVVQRSVVTVAFHEDLAPCECFGG